MSEIGENLKNIVMKGIEVLGNKANSFASSAKQKVDEFNLANEQKELFSQIGSKVFELAKKGVEFPEEIKEDLKKASEIGESLELIRKEKEDAAIIEKAEDDDAPAYGDSSDETPPAKEPEAEEYAASDDHDVPVIEVNEAKNEEETDFSDCPLSSAINDLFEKMPPVDKMMDKVNSSLDELDDNLRKFSGEFDKQLNEFADKMMGKDDQDPQ